MANLTDSLQGDQAGEQQAPRQVKTKITSARRAGAQQRLERCHIGLADGKVAGSTAYHQAGPSVINGGDNVAPERDQRSRR